MSAGTVITLGLCLWGFFCAGAMALVCLRGTIDWLRSPASVSDAAIGIVLVVGFATAAFMSGSAVVDLWGGR